MSKEEAMERGFHFAPLLVQVEGEWYEDGVTMTKEEFNRGLEGYSSIPTTSQVPPYTFETLYEKVVDEAIVITMSKEVSGTYQSAVIAANHHPKIHIVDCLKASVGERVLIEYADRLIKEGLDCKTIVEKLEDVKDKICLLAILDSLTYVYKGGRLSKTQAILGSLLKVKPILTMEDGKIAALGKSKGVKKACRFIESYVEAHGGIDVSMPYACSYSGVDPSIVDKYFDQCTILTKEELARGAIEQTGAGIGTHAGPNAIFLAYFRNE